jgi:phospho-N-acetylmuramoyl-pentapeptide-transferase
MGGILILLAAMGAVLLWTSFNSLVIVTVTVYILCTLVGALDDIVKIVMGRSKGLNCWQKLIFQGLITWGVVKLALSDPPLNNLLLHFDWQYFNQFEPKDVLWGISIFYFLVLAGTSNAVNITDGVDGLAIANVMLCLLFLGIAAFFSRSVAVASHSLLTYSAGAGELAVLCFCFIGAGLAFALFNCHPASVFMGDMGSIGLGGLLAIVALLLRIPFALLLAGFIFVVEAISVMLQVTSKKVFRRRIFLMAPLHHHFELRGYSEKKIVGAAVLVQLAATAAAFIVVFYGYWSH